MHAERLIAALTAGATALLVLAGATSPVLAGEGDGVSGTPFVDGNQAGYELEGVQQLGGVVRGPGVPAWLRECSWQEMAHDEFTAFVHSLSGVGGSVAVGSGDRSWKVVLCSTAPAAQLAAGDRWGFGVTNILEAWQVGDPVPRRFIDWLIAYGYSLVDIPLQVSSSSPAGDTVAPLIAQLDTWLWIDSSDWATRSATTPAVFGVTATVTAEPYSVVFRTSEGEVIDCQDNLGAVYDYSRPGGAQSTGCSVVYRDASSVADQTLTSTVRWRVTYSCSSSACPSGTLPDFVITTTRDVRVAEIVGVGIATED